jgi:DNA-binding CsgD family transcriptional regulator
MAIKKDTVAYGKSHIAKDFDSLLFTQGFLAFVATITALSLAVYWFQLNIITISKQDTENWQVLAMVYGVLPVLVGLCLASFRLFAKLSLQNLAKSIALAAVLIGTVFAPFLLYLGFQETAVGIWLFSSGWAYLLGYLVLFTLGYTAIIYLWTLYLCSLNHHLLTFQLAVGICLSVGLAAVIIYLATGPLVITVIQCLLFLLAWLFLLTANTEPAILKVSHELSKKRAITVKNDRWTYCIIGIDFGFALYLLLSSDNQFGEIVSGFFPENTLHAAAFLLPVLLASLLLYVCRYKFDYLLEKWSKDHLCITIVLPLLLICFVPPIGQFICKMALLFVVSLQIVIVLSASIEFIRSFKLSPTWYLGEDAFVAVSVGIGIGVAALDGVLSALLPFESALPLSFAVIILVNMSAQLNIEKGYYPNSSLNRVVEVPPPHVFQLQRDDDDFDEASSSHKARWRSKVLLVGGRYNLSARQIEIAEFLAKGRNAQFIADYLFLSKATVKTHIANIYAKLNIHSHQELLDIIESSTPSE